MFWFLIDVWSKPWTQLTMLDRMVIAVEPVLALFAIAIVKVYIIDWLRGVEYYREK